MSYMQGIYNQRAPIEEEYDAGRGGDGLETCKVK